MYNILVLGAAEIEAPSLTEDWQFFWGGFCSMFRRWKIYDDCCFVFGQIRPFVAITVFCNNSPGFGLSAVTTTCIYSDQCTSTFSQN